MADLFYISYTVRLDISAFLKGLSEPGGACAPPPNFLQIS